MSFDFSNLSAANSLDTAISPRDIFALLPQKDPKYQYPRDVQSEVWSKWNQARDRRDTVIRMNTGSGKTVVGLLILKSCLNENVRPAAYLAPDQYLVRQVIATANELGIRVTDDPHSPRYLKGTEILVTTIRTLVNGQSKFGVGSEGMKIPIGTLLIDDAHACLETTQDQFTMTLSSGLAKSLLELFIDDLRQQSPTQAAEVWLGSPTMLMEVPFWAWQKKQQEVIRLIQTAIPKPRKREEGNDGLELKLEQKEPNDDSLRFNYPLIREVLVQCRCIFRGTKVEISPRVVPISSIPSFELARRRIAMSATLADDGILVSHFDFSPDSIENSIAPNSANDIGDRMILVPQEIAPAISDTEVKNFCHKLSLVQNVVVIVPSKGRARFWSDVAKEQVLAENIDDVVARLKNGHVGLCVLINKYDGIDLPKAACSVLVIDGIPRAYRYADMADQAILIGTDQILAQKVQKIEQGMGRGIRSSDDHCLIILMGRDLIKTLYLLGARENFSPATLAQWNLSERLSSQMTKESLEEIDSVAAQFLQRDKGWLTASKAALVGTPYSLQKAADPITVAQRQSFRSLTSRNYRDSAAVLNAVINKTTDEKIKGWLKSILAETVNFYDQAEAQELLKSANSLNSRVFHPIDGITYSKFSQAYTDQRKRSVSYIKQKFQSENHLLIHLEDLVNRLAFIPDTHDDFEEAFKEIGLLIGFESQRPEADFKQGPDVLWRTGERDFFVIECKNGVTSQNPINKEDCNQLNGSASAWCPQKYGDCSVTPILVHPKTVYEYAATLPAETRIIDLETLELLKNAVRKYTNSVVNNWATIEGQKSLIGDCGLTMEQIRGSLKKARRIQ